MDKMFEENKKRLDRIIAIRSHVLGLTNTCPECEEKK